MMRIGKAGSCLVALVVSTMYMNDVLAGALINEEYLRKMLRPQIPVAQPQTPVAQQQTPVEQHTPVAQPHHEADDPVIPASAGPRTPAVRILQVRPYVTQNANPGLVFVEVDQTTVCNTSVYSIDMANGGSREAYATVLASFIVDKPVIIELVNSGCAGAGTKIQSIFLNR